MNLFYHHFFVWVDASDLSDLFDFFGLLEFVESVESFLLVLVSLLLGNEALSFTYDAGNSAILSPITNAFGMFAIKILKFWASPGLA